MTLDATLIWIAAMGTMLLVAYIDGLFLIDGR